MLYSLSTSFLCTDQPRDISAVKPFSQYFRDTIIMLYLLKKNSLLTHHAFFDADWTENVDSRTSTNAYVVFLDANAIS